jgi:cell division protein FtsW (lipid II flippase)
MSEKSRPAFPVATAAGLFALASAAVAAACLSVLGVKLGNAPALAWGPMLPLGFYFAGFIVALVWMRMLGWAGDPGLFGAVALLSGVGLVVQFRMGSFSGGLADWVTVLAFPVGLAAFLVGVSLTARGRGEWLSRTGWLAYLAAVGMLAAMLLLGRKFRGGMFMPGNMNPSEVVKPLLVFFLASYLSRRQKEFSETQAGIPVPSFTALLGLVALWGVPLLLSLLLHDLGLMILLNAILMIMLFAIARRTGYLAIGLALVTVAGFAVQHLSAHARVRFDVWLNPFADPTGKAWQVLQALSAMYSGGLWGSGLGSGVPQSIPVVTSDFIYAAMAEEIGLAGCVLILFVFAVFFSRSFRAAGAAPTPYGRLLGVGLAGSLAVQTVLNVAGVTKALPMTGITLPFISHGGSSLVTTLLIAGLLVGLSDRKGK